MGAFIICVSCVLCKYIRESELTVLVSLYRSAEREEWGVGGYDQGSQRPNQLHCFPHHVWREAEGYAKAFFSVHFPFGFPIIVYSVSIIHSLCLWKVLTPKTSLCLPSRCWTQRALAPSRRNCESIFTDILFPCRKKRKIPYLTATLSLSFQPRGASDHSVRQVHCRGGEIRCCSSLEV